MNAFRLASCAGKVRFESYVRAKTIAHRSAQNFGGKRSAYKCDLCHGYHVGEPIKQRETRRALLAGLTEIELYDMESRE